MMSSRAAGKEPVHAMPSREEFLKLPEDQRNQINEAFTVFDSDRDGRIDYVCGPMLLVPPQNSLGLDALVADQT